MRFRTLAFVAAALTFTALFAAGRGDPQSTKAKLKKYDSAYYTIYTDLEPDDVKETLIRMTKMAEEYHERTKGLFRGTISQKLPFYLFTNKEDYYEAGGMPGSAGVFMGDVLMSTAMRNREGHVGMGTWHVVQHEGFHQFVHYVIRGQVPTWANEGLAEYFGEGIFTGDSMITGVISAYRLKRIQAGIQSKTFKSVKELMLIQQGEWNQEMSGANYDQAWSMVHFLAQGENGKYQDAFAQFLVLVGQGKTWDRAWTEAFGSAEGFEEKWKDYWLKMPENPTINLYAKAATAAMTSYLGRAYSQKQTFDKFEEFIKTDAKDLKAGPTDWLPPSLYTAIRGLTEKLTADGFSFTFIRGKTPIPQIECVTRDGTKLIGTFTLRGNAIGKVSVEEIKKPATQPAASMKSK